MQRLFSTFPNGGPGAALLLLRLASGGFLIMGKLPIPGEFPPAFAPEAYIAFVVLGFALLLGLWTPVMATATAMLEGLTAFYGAGNYSTHILLIVLAISLALLGPGAWSLDARVFGRKRIDI